MADPKYIASGDLYEANAALCEFAERWSMDGDYMRCRICQRPQLTSYARYPFPHDAGCLGAQAHEARPWITFVQLLAPLSKAVGNG
ncbi:TPA: hypothetical protein ACOEPG_000444 [Stenotrophomonas maltophilia]|uniref:hypothetical protein n=1 Tax=Stenotrophomonas maltophilia TaxID=40324 RepID=UPI000C157075|nr:hypothetical protein [Stenotrophomonas maltophilia]